MPPAPPPTRDGFRASVSTTVFKYGSSDDDDNDVIIYYLPASNGQIHNTSGRDNVGQQRTVNGVTEAGTIEHRRHQQHRLQQLATPSFTDNTSVQSGAVVLAIAGMLVKRLALGLSKHRTSSVFVVIFTERVVNV